MFKYIRKKFLRGMQVYEINMQELQQKQQEGAIVIDVRSTQEYSEGHLTNAINIPYYEISKKIEDIVSSKETVIIVYCGVGARGKRAYKILKKLQYKNVYNLHGGLENWQ